MKTDDITFMNIALDALGCRRSEWAHYLGTGWKSWKPFHTERLQALIKKRIDLLRRDGKNSRTFLDMADTWQRAWDRIEDAKHYEEYLLRGKRSLTLMDLRSMAQENETTVQALEKVCRNQGWSRVKIQGRVIWQR